MFLDVTRNFLREMNHRPKSSPEVLLEDDGWRTDCRKSVLYSTNMFHDMFVH
jgi:hypothetical protein